MTTPFLKASWTIIRKDLRAELRTRELMNSMLLFAMLSIFIFSFALELDRTARQEAVTGVLWVTVIYASILGLNRSLVTEKENGSLDAMMIAPVSRVAIYAGKLVGNFLFTLVIGVVLLPLMTVLYTISVLHLEIVLLLALGILALSAVGTLLATMTVQTRARETLLPIAMMPTAIPVLMVVVNASLDVLNGVSRGNWLLTLVLIDVVYITAGSILFEYVIED
jgi:heme exporter protein B